MTVLRDEFRTDDLSEAEEYIGQSYGAAALRAEKLTFTEQSVGDHRFALRRLRVDGGYSAECDLERVIILQSESGFRWKVDRDRGTAVQPVLFQPGSTLACALEDTRVRVVSLPLPALTSVARSVYNDDSLTVRFDGARASTASLRHAWKAAADLAFAATPTLENDLMRASVYRSLAVTALEAFALVGDHRERSASVRQQYTAYRKAVAFLDENASLPITIDDAAVAAGVSARALRRAFRSHAPAGRTPSEHLRAVRIDAAHADLVRADPGQGETVAAIAARWGLSERAFTEGHVRAYGIRPGAILDEGSSSASG